jgi:hypothetical protein
MMVGTTCRLPGFKFLTISMSASELGRDRQLDGSWLETGSEAQRIVKIGR